ncbi:MAG: Membrane dipeptidase (Peptidase family M19) [Deltaproteobacteria bacterium ADurb.Bin207]|jgi:membrane dipeptidase|nr:MAG: Membrane dipeptidase (Peptidase family M19) [Deltaproteobacteria bacterium ADurb.Bin207]
MPLYALLLLAWPGCCPPEFKTSQGDSAADSAVDPAPQASTVTSVPSAPLEPEFPFITMLMHADTPYQLMKGKNIGNETAVHLSLPRLRQGKIDAFSAVLFVESASQNENTALYCQRATKKIDALLEDHSGLLRLALTPEDFKTNRYSGHISVFRTLEGSFCLRHGIYRIEDLYASGIRMIGLTWENDHDFATSWVYHGPIGLTERGKNAVVRMNHLGIIVDVSHMSDRAIDDVLAISQAPIVASHSNARSVCPHPRNLNDAHIRAIAEKGGLIGVNFYPPHLVQSGKATLAHVVQHIRYLRDVGGIGCVGLGSDFDGISKGPSGLETAAELPRLRETLLAEGFSEPEVAAIFGGNFLRLFNKVQALGKH